MGCLTVFLSQLERFELIQNEAMRIILGCTKDIPLVCMRFILGIPTIFDRYKILQAKLYLLVACDKEHLLHDELDTTKGNRLKRGRSWMAQAKLTIRDITDIKNISHCKAWVRVPANLSQIRSAIVTQGCECKDWPHGSTEMEIQHLIQDNSQPEDVVIYKDGSMVRGFKSGWGFLAEANGQIMTEESHAYDMTTSSIRMEVEVVTASFHSLENSQFSQVVYVTDLLSMLRKIEIGMYRVEWLESV